MKTLILTALLVAPYSQAATTETKEFTGKNITQLEVENKSGNVTILGKNTDKISVASEKLKFSDKCSISFKQSEDEIKIESGKKSFFTEADCVVKFTITVPKKMNLDLQTASGDIDVTGTEGKIAVKIGAGNANIRSEVTDLDVKAGSGDLQVHGLTGDANIILGAGNVKLTYIKDPGKGEIDIKSGSGNTDLYFPPKMKIHSKSIVGAG